MFAKQVNTDGWQGGFYWMSLIFACIFNMNDSIFQVTYLRVSF